MLPKRLKEVEGRRRVRCFARFSNTDIYIFEHAAGFIQCCGCTLKSRLKPEEERIVEYLSRPLPQLPITVDAEGYLIAQSDFLEPIRVLPGIVN